MIKDKKWLITLIILFSLTFFLRLRLAVKLPIWIDEAIVFNLAKNKNFTDLVTGNYWDASHPPLLHLITKIQLFFIKESSLLFFRSIHIFFASLTVFPLAKIVYKLTKSKLATITSLALYACHPLLIENTFSVRPYSLISLCFTLILLINPEFKNQKIEIKKFLFTNFLVVFSFYLDYSSLWFLIPFVLISIHKNRNILQVLKYLWPSVLLVCLWLPTFYNNFHQLQLLNAYAKDKLFQFFIEEIFGIMNFWERSEYISQFGYFIYLFSFVAAIIFFLKQNKKYRIYSIYFLFPVLFIFTYSQLNAPAYISRQFISLAIISCILLSSLAKNKSFTFIITVMAIINLTNAYSLNPNFRYLSFTNENSIKNNTNSPITILYPYYNLDALDYFLRNNNFIRSENTYDPVLYHKNNQTVFAYITATAIKEEQKDKYFFIHKQDITNETYFENIEKFCKIPKEKTQKYLKEIKHFSFLKCN